MAGIEPPVVQFLCGGLRCRPVWVISQAFRVKITEVTGFSVTKSGKMPTRTFNVLSQHVVAPTTQPVSPASVADEIKKLGELRSQGLLTDEEFAAQKARLLDGA